ncbi:MAG TPA: hypothetical protein EYG95_01465 [Campylobacterales bacterium]|nr:hypothetical protein [Campylobacterales bacterium]
MKNKRTVSALLALSLVMVANITTNKGYDATTVQAVNMDLVMLTVSSLKQVDEKMKQCAHDRNCDK